jgi:hypothetical protein
LACPARALAKAAETEQLLLLLLLLLPPLRHRPSSKPSSLKNMYEFLILDVIIDHGERLGFF